jgi:hypothetical protein
VKLTETPDPGSTFSGWYEACGGTLGCTVTLKSNATVIANFNLTNPQFLFAQHNNGTGGGTVTSSPAGISCGTTCVHDFPGGTTVKLTAAPNSGSAFAGWSGVCSGTSTCTVDLTANASATATFNSTSPLVQLTVHSAGTGAGTIKSSLTGINCGFTCSANFPSGTSVKLTETPTSGAKFAGWSGACSGISNTCTLALTAAASATATFTSAAAPVQLTVLPAGTGAGTVTSSLSGISCGATCTASFPSGTPVTLTAIATAGSTFAGWSGPCTGMGTCNLTLTASTTVTPTFEAGTANITALNHIVFFAQ